MMVKTHLKTRMALKQFYPQLNLPNYHPHHLHHP
jgi:hypothetical protein